MRDPQSSDDNGPQAPGERRMSVGDAGYVSARAADALLSDLRPTTLQPQCLAYLNELLDELLSSIIKGSLGLETGKLKTQAINAIIPPPLGRDAVGEAELELLSWLDSEEGKASRGTNEIRYVATPGQTSEPVWPWKEAWELMRVMTQSYSTLGDRPPSDALEQSFIAALSAQGGDVRPAIIDPAALYLTAILEHVAEYTLGSLSRVMTTEQGTTVAGPKELYSALCEDEALYGMVKKMQIKTVIERAMQVSRKSTSSHSGSTTKKASAVSGSFPSNYSVASAASDLGRPAALNGSTIRTIPHDFAASQPSSAELRSSLDSSNGPISPPVSHQSKQSFSLGRKSTSSSRYGGSIATGEGSSREHKASMQSYEEELEDERAEEEREFDEFLRGGKTMKLSLTPHSLKSTETQDLDSAPRRNRSVARRPVPAMDDQPQGNRANGAGLPSSSLRRNVSSKVGQGGPTPRFSAREPTHVDEDEEYEEDEEDIMMRGGRKQPKKESLAELLSSPPPWAGNGDSPARLVKANASRSVPSSPAPPAAYRPTPAQAPSASAALNKRLGIQEPVPASSSVTENGSPASPPLGSMRHSPSMPGTSKFDRLAGAGAGPASPSSNRPQARGPKSYEEDSDSDDELLGRPKQRPLRSADLIAFLDGPPPNSKPNLPDEFDNGTTKSKKKGLRGLVSKLTGGGSAGSSSPSSSRATDGLLPPSSFNGNSVRSNKSSAQHQSSGSMSSRVPGLRRSRSDISVSGNDSKPSSSSAPFIASTSEPIPPRMRSRSQGGSQASIPTSDPAPPLPSHVLADVIPPARSTSRARGQSAAPVSTHPASASARSSPRASVPPSFQQDQFDETPLPSIIRTSLADQEGSVRPSISSFDAEAAPSRATRVALAGASLAPATILASPTMDVSPVPSEAPSFGFPAKLATPTEELEPENAFDRDQHGFDALGMPIKEVGPGPVPGPAESTTELAYAAPPSPTTTKAEPASTAPIVIPSAPVASTSIPSVPHSSLHHLRTLLAHATTADECRLLVGALLGRWGVPLPADAEEADPAELKREEQVGRMHGWLLEEYAAAPEPPAQGEAKQERQEEEEEEQSEYGSAKADVESPTKDEIVRAGGVIIPDVATEEESAALHGGEGAVL